MKNPMHLSLPIMAVNPLLTRSLLLVLASFFLFLPKSRACNCGPPIETFCESIESNTIVVQAIITDSIANYLREIAILQNLNIGIAEEKVTLIGQDGLNCGEDLRLFAIGDTLVLGLYFEEMEQDTGYILYGCNKNFLRYSEGMVVGGVSREIESQPYDVFIDNLQTCLDLVNAKESALSPLHIYPNPVTDLLRIDNLGAQRHTIELFSLDGRQVYRKTDLQQYHHELTVSNLQAGIYLLRITNADATYTAKIMVN